MVPGVRRLGSEILRRARRHRLSVDAIDLIRYPGPSRRNYAFPPVGGLVVRVKSSCKSGPIFGFGEATVASGQMERAWGALEKYARRLLGSPLPHRADNLGRALASIEGWSPARASMTGSRKAAKLALEAALIDLLLQAGSMQSSPASGGRRDSAYGKPVRWGRIYRIPDAPPGAEQDKLSAALKEDEGQSWALRLRLSGQSDLDLEWLKYVGRIEREAGRDRKMWLSADQVYFAPEAAAGFISEVAKLMAQSMIPAKVLLEDPLPAEHHDHYANLQEAADRTLMREEPSRSRTKQLRVIAGASVDQVEQVDNILTHGRIGGLHLSLTRWGTLLGLQEAAGAVKHKDPSAKILVSGAFGSDLSSKAIADLVRFTPEIDYYDARTEGSSGWPQFMSSSGGSQRHNPGDVEIARLAAVADGFVSLSERDDRSDSRNRLNLFPRVAPSSQWEIDSPLLLEVAALQSGFRTRRVAHLRSKRFSSRFFLVEQEAGEIVMGFSGAEPSATSSASSMVAHRKEVSRLILGEQGLPIAQGYFFRAEELETAYAAGVKMGFPLVVKPAAGSKGVGVFTGVASEADLQEALAAVASSRYGASGFIVEQFISGSDYRVLVTPDKVLSVVRREPASVIGDGRRTVEELVLIANSIRRQNPSLSGVPIILDQDTDRLLAQQGLNRKSVANYGQKVLLRSVANLSQGGDSYEVLDSTHLSVLELAMSAVAAVPDLPYAGIDMIMKDHRLPIGEQQVAIIELNSNPMLTMHHFPLYGPVQDVSASLLGALITDVRPKVQSHADELAIGVSLRGRVQKVGFRRWLAGAAESLGVAGWVANSADPEKLTARFQGAPVNVGLLLRMAFHGPPPAEVLEICADPVEHEEREGFTVFDELEASG